MCKSGSLCKCLRHSKGRGNDSENQQYGKGWKTGKGLLGNGAHQKHHKQEQAHQAVRERGISVAFFIDELDLSSQATVHQRVCTCGIGSGAYARVVHDEDKMFTLW